MLYSFFVRDRLPRTPKQVSLFNEIVTICLIQLLDSKFKSCHLNSSKANVYKKKKKCVTTVNKVVLYDLKHSNETHVMKNHPGC